MGETRGGGIGGQVRACRRAALAAPAIVLLGLAATAPALAVEGSRFRAAVQSRGGVVATESAAAARVGRGVLRAGGNAIDAAVATTFAIGVARPQSCGIGGGGFLVYRSAGGRVATLDFRERAPASVTPTTFAGPGPHRTFTGHRTVGVPGTVAGMAAALDRFGTISLSEAVSPAAELARRGTTVPQSLSSDMATNAERLRLFPESARQFLAAGGAPHPAGARLRQPALAVTLALVARGGPDAFYRGRVAERIVASMGTAAQQLPGDVGLMTRADLAAYRAKWRQPLVGSYRGRTVIAMPPPTSGGIATLEMLNLLEGFDLRSAGQATAEELHLIAESQKIAFADRGAYVGDPDFLRVPADVLTSKPYAARRRGEIDRARAKTYRPGDVSAVAARAAGADLNPRASTTHVSVIDATGNAVAVTCTIEQSFGSAVTAPGTGVLLNNELTDFSDPGTANEPRGGKRPRSSISPTIVVEDGRPALAVGGAGGVRIIMGSLFAVVNRVDFGQDVAHAVDGERIDANGPRLTVEERRVAPAALTDLQVRGHALAGVGEYDTRPRVQAAGVDPRTGLSLGVSDPRADFGTLANRRPAPGVRAWSGREDNASPRARLVVKRRSGGVVELSARARDRGRSGVAFVVFQVHRPDGGAGVWTTLGRSVTAPRRAVASASVVGVDLGGPGAYRFRVRASDRAGNVSAFDAAGVHLRGGAVRLRLEE